MYATLNGTGGVGFVTNYTNVIACCLNFTYPNGTLIANVPVTVSGRIHVENQHIDQVTIIFPNSLLFPLSNVAETGFPKQGSLNYIAPFNGTVSVDYNSTSGIMIIDGKNGTLHGNIMVGSSDTQTTQILWPIQGDYAPLIGVHFDDGTSQSFSIDDTKIHVYPPEQATQIESERVALEMNQASLKLSIAVFVLSILSAVTLFFQIVDRNETDCKYTQAQGNTQYTCPYVHEQNSKGRVVTKPKHPR
jgi:hypothetical protein